MHPSSYWSDFPADYQTEAVAQIVPWFAVGESGAVCGIGPTGRSNLLGYIANRSDVWQQHLPPNHPPLCCIFFDAVMLLQAEPIFFYRGMLEALYQQVPAQYPQVTEAFKALMAMPINYADTFDLYVRLQLAHEVVIRTHGISLVWLFNRFDRVCQLLDPAALTSLRSLRDQFKGQCAMVVALSQPTERIAHRQDLDFLYEILAGNTCWLGPMVERDARWVIQQMSQRLQLHFTEDEIQRMLKVTGGQPAFLRSVISARHTRDLAMSESLESWITHLLARAEVVRVCQVMDDSLTAVERQLLSEVALGSSLKEEPHAALNLLTKAGLILLDAQKRWRIFSPIYQAHLLSQVAGAADQAVGIALHPQTRVVLRNGTSLGIELTASEDQLLSYFLAHIDEICTKEMLMAAIWPADQLLEGIRDDRLAQLVKRLREKIEEDPSSPRCIQTVRGRGYRFMQGG